MFLLVAHLNQFSYIFCLISFNVFSSSFLSTIVSFQLRVHDAMEYALRAKRVQDDVAVQKLIRDILAIPTLQPIDGRLTAMRDIAVGERVLSESPIVHTVRKFDDRVDRNYVHMYVQDLCKAVELEAGAGAEMDHVMRLIVSLIQEGKHKEYLELYPPHPDDAAMYVDPTWLERLTRHLNGVSAAELKALWAVVTRTRVDFCSPHVGVLVRKRRVVQHLPERIHGRGPL